jgi:hypothetical protein
MSTLETPGERGNGVHRGADQPSTNVQRAAQWVSWQFEERLTHQNAVPARFEWCRASSTVVKDPVAGLKGRPAAKKENLALLSAPRLAGNSSNSKKTQRRAISPPRPQHKKHGELLLSPSSVVDAAASLLRQPEDSLRPRTSATQRGAMAVLPRPPSSFNPFNLLGTKP